MRHPFAEIIDAVENDKPTPSRRSVLGGFLSALAGATGLLGGRTASAESQTESTGEKPAPEPKDEGTGKAANDYRLYLVVPLKGHRFTTKRRAEMGIGGPYTHGWEGNEDWKDLRGFLAWLTADQAKKLLFFEEVGTVCTIGPKHKKITGSPNRGSGKLIVRIEPNQWPVKPEADSYYSVKQIVDGWAKKFADAKSVKFASQADTVEVTFENGKIHDKVIEGIKAHPQVGLLAWADGPTTKALGEEGGATTKRRGEEGATTLAVGEEGGPFPSTRALGEEGGIPRPTTLRVGEEGGRPFPRPVPRPEITTKAIGEEGGRPGIKLPDIKKISTEALGEEG